jgi:DHA1 family tetracycline resistance protein-like MFS transporter
MRPALLSASLSAVAMMLVLFMLPESHGLEQRARTAGTPRERGWQLLRTLPGLRLLALATLLVTFSQSTLESIFAIWAVDRYHVGPMTVGLTLFVLAIVAVGAQGGLVRRLAPRYGERRVAIAGILSYVAGLAVVAVGGALGLVIVGLVFCGLGSGLFSPSGAALASHQARSHNRGAVMGVYQSGTSTARVIAPFVAGPVYMQFGPAAPYLLACAVTLQALWCLFGLARGRAGEATAAQVEEGGPLP